MRFNFFVFCRYGAYLVLLCNVAMSYAHALELFHDLVVLPYEFLYHVGVISLDMVFVLSVMVLTESGGRGLPPWICFLFGLGFTTWSNIRPALKADDAEGVALGICTVAALLLLKIMISWMERNPELFHRVTQPGYVDANRVMGTPKPGANGLPFYMGNIPAGESEYTAGDNREKPGEPVDLQGIEAGGSDWITEDEPIDQEQPVSEEITRSNQAGDELGENLPVMGEAGDNQETETTRSKQPGEIVVDDLMGDDPSPGLEKALAKCLELLKDGHKLPGRRKLAELAGVSEHYAKRAKEIMATRGLA
jgi:hypothetical protein